MKELFRFFLIIGIVVGTLISAKLVLDLIQTYRKTYIDAGDGFDLG